MGEALRQQSGDAPALKSILTAAERYRHALVRLYDELGIMAAYAGSPDYLLARLVVAEVTGGVALPAADGQGVGVFGPEGQPIRVFTTELRDGFRRFFYVSHSRNDEECLALVVFDRGVPAFVHYIPADRVASVMEAFRDTGPRHSGGLTMSLYLHCDFMADSLKAEVLGVTTHDLRNQLRGIA